VVGKLKNYKLILEYDGTNYHGFQKQKEAPTIQGELEKSLSIWLRERIEVKGASRTDAGAHALGQVVNFKTGRETSPQEILKRTNAILPKDIAIIDVEEVDSSFHARKSARSRLYEYYVFTRKSPSPFFSRFSFHFPYQLSLEKMREASLLFKGKHDFSAFTTTQEARNPEREIYHISVEEKGDFIVLSFHANSFLHNMIRNLVSSLLRVGRGEVSKKELKDILESKERGVIEPAPSKGLFLVKVFY
jgi:tRNA pseudouridine38-40 synthase